MPTPTKRAVKRMPAKPREDEDADGEEEVEERPKRTAKRSAAGGADDELRGGWTAAQDTMDSTSSFAQTLKPEEKSQVIKFLDDEPYVNYRRHWIERSSPQGKSTRSYTCLKSFKPTNECPLCDVGDRPQAVAAFNVALIGDDGVVSLKSWDVGAKIFNILKGYANDPKIAPLTRGFFLVSRTGKKGTVNHQVIPVKASALEEDYDIPVPDKAAFDRLEKYDKGIVEIPTKKSLKEVSDEIADDYE